MSKLLKQSRTDKKFYIPAEIQQWIVIIYELRSKFSANDEEKMVSSFLDACDGVGKQGFSSRINLLLSVYIAGIRVHQRKPLVAYANGHADHEKQFKNAENECKEKFGGLPSLVVLVLPENGADIRRAIK